MDGVYLKIYTDTLEALEELDDAAAGRLLRAMLLYRRDGEAPKLSGAERVLFPVFRAQIDREKTAYEEICRRNRKNGSRSSPAAPSGSQSPPAAAPRGKTRTKTNTKTKTMTKNKSSSGSALSPAAETAKPYGAYGNVLLTEAQHAGLEKELGAAETERCIRLVDELAQSTGNRNGWKDWALVVRRCRRDGWGRDFRERGPTGTPASAPETAPCGPRPEDIERMKKVLAQMDG